MKYLQKIFGVILICIGAVISFLSAILALFSFGVPGAAPVFSALLACGVVILFCGFYFLKYEKKGETKNAIPVQMKAPQPIAVTENVQQPDEEELFAVVCSACGGVCHLPANTSGKCDYCDSPISR